MACTKHGVWLDQEVCVKCLLDQIASLTARLAASEAALVTERERVKTAHAEGADAIIASFSHTDLRGRVCELEAENAELQRALAAEESELTAAVARAEKAEAFVVGGMSRAAHQSIVEDWKEMLSKAESARHAALAKLRELKEERDRLRLLLKAKLPPPDHMASRERVNAWLDIVAPIKSGIAAAREDAVRPVFAWINESSNNQRSFGESVDEWVDRYLASLVGKEPSDETR
jgi:hypothetical protein